MSERIESCNEVERSIERVNICPRCQGHLITDEAESVWGHIVPAMWCVNCEALYPLNLEVEN